MKFSIRGSIKTFGMIEGIRFWIWGNITEEIKLFYRKKILHKKWCLWHAYSCEIKECEYPHYDEPLKCSNVNGKE